MIVVPQSIELEAATFPCRIRDGRVVLLPGGGAQVIEAAGRTCYRSEDRITEDSAGPFIARLFNHETPHASVIEHASASFRIVCDRGVSHELVRHRLATYSQESTRYCNYSKGKFGGQIVVIQPPELVTPEDVDDWREACEYAEMKYLRLLGRGRPPEIARSVLPTCLKTEVVATMNFRQWLHVLSLRRARRAHPQIREIAQGADDQLQILCPEVFARLAA